MLHTFSTLSETTVTTTVSTFQQGSDEHRREYLHKKSRQTLRRTKDTRSRFPEFADLPISQLYKRQGDLISGSHSLEIRVVDFVGVSFEANPLYYQSEAENANRNQNPGSMTDENRPPSIFAGPSRHRTTPSAGGKVTEIIKPVHTPNNENDRGAIRTQVLRGADHLTGLARHEFKRDGKFGAPPPNPIGVLSTSIATTDANIRTVELDTNICKAEWVKSTIDWPYPYLFDRFCHGFDDAKYSRPNESIINRTKKVNYNEDVLTEDQWNDRAYTDGTKFGKKYMADRPTPKKPVITTEFEIDKVRKGYQVDTPLGNIEDFFDRAEARIDAREEAKRKKKREDLLKCKRCIIA
ncbi:hypothetical protein ABW19_dt0210430 [Dactylella cylindrospora]|nr:hypothetical protein ABW19_dt0210430 [Dactylella cylindrospora]